MRIRWTRVGIVLALLLVLVLVLIGPEQSKEAPQLPDDESIVLVVDGVPYTDTYARTEYALLPPNIQNAFGYERFIEDILLPKIVLLDRATRDEYTADEQAVQTSLVSVQENFAAQGLDFERDYLDAINLSLDTWLEKKREELIIDALIDEEIASKIIVTDQQVRTEYELLNLSQANLTYEEIEEDLRAYLIAQRQDDALGIYLQQLLAQADVSLP